MKLYYSKGACSLAVRIVMNELNLPCEYESVNLKTKQTETGGDYFKINAKGSVPTLVLNNKEILTENSAIQQYLVDSQKNTQLLPPVGNMQRYHVLEWLSFVSTDLHKGFGPLFNPTVPEQVKEDIFKPLLKNKFNFVDQHLGQHTYLAGDEYTLPDGYLFVLLRWLPHFKLDLPSHWKNLAVYFDNLKKRPSIHKSLTQEGLA